MKLFQRVLAVLLCALLAVPLTVGAADDPYETDPISILNDDSGEMGEDEPEKHASQIELSDTQILLTVGTQTKLTAEVKNFETPDTAITWSTDNSKVATVDDNGTVTAKGKGHAVISAVATDGETTATATCSVTVTSRRNFYHYLMMIGYRYTNLGDYYFSDNNYAWQKPFGFIRLYDTASQLIGYQYDFARVVFTYGNKDWLVEFWKGQYAFFQFGGEIGVYTKYSAGFGDTAASVYNSPARSDWLDMEMTLYHRLADGSVRREFTRDYGKYWWCDGYKIGRLNKSKPAEELQMVSRITLKDEKMAEAFVEGMLDCGFKQVENQENLTDDTFCLDGCDVYFIWRNLTNSQRLIPVIIDGGSSSFPSIFDGLASIIRNIRNGLNTVLAAG